MKNSLIKAYLILFIALLVPSQTHAAMFSFEGNISMIEKDYLVLDGTRFQLSNEYTEWAIRNNCGADTRYYTSGGTEITFGTIAGVGYVERAGIMVENGCVRTLQVLEMHL